MRVLFCTDTYPPQINGVSIVTALSVAGLRRLGWECAVVAPQYPVAAHLQWGSAEAERPDATVETLSLPSMAMPGYPEIRLAWPGLSPVRALVERFRPDLVHCATEFTIGRVGQIAARRAGIPLVSSFHTDFGRYAEAYGMPWLRSAVSSHLARFHRRSSRVYTPSTVSRAEVLKLGSGHAGGARHGKSLHFLYVGRLAVDVPHRRGIPASRHDPPRRRRHRAARGGDPRRRAARRHFSRFPRAPEPAA